MTEAKETPAESPDWMQPYRQPLVTATGIILGFILGFAGTFVRTDSGTPEWASYLVFALILLGIFCLLRVLTRTLRADITAEAAPDWYRHTLRLFTIGITSAFGGAIVDMFSNFMSE